MTVEKRVRHFQVLLSPVVTEKSTLVAAGGSVAVFKVDPRATKGDVREAVEVAYGVKVAAINIVRQMGKPKGSMRTVGRRAQTKKAYVTLAPGQKLSVVEGM